MAPKKADKSPTKAKAAKGGVEKPAKKVKKVKDPNAPKRPLSAFFFYSNDIREQVKSDNPGIAFGEIGKKVGALWAALSEKDKAPYEKKAEADKARYEKEKAAYTKA
ncbi:hypothetical protein ACKKBG_A04205 [Auxenochlorella protothecoides x Auxenochlorella symbiontica]|uniref:HMG box domain-containing protein n=1 Tax=Auxenochlorella protothecoides TaxID=3075 RepID=A0A1D2AAU9_AUXPR